MKLPTHVTVTAPDGRLTPIHPDDGVGLGGAPLRVTSETVARVRWSQTTRRAVARGDLLLCDAAGKPVTGPHDAAAPDDLGAGSRPVGAARAATPAPNMRVNDGGGR